MKKAGETVDGKPGRACQALKFLNIKEKDHV